MKYEINKKVNGPLYVTEEDEMKLNYRCKKEEQNGEGKGSCSGNSGESNVVRDNSKLRDIVTKEFNTLLSNHNNDKKYKIEDDISPHVIRMLRDLKSEPNLTIENIKQKAINLLDEYNKDKEDKIAVKYMPEQIRTLKRIIGMKPNEPLK